jgi:Histidine kinase-, DNA gyrase B-, and HSP90-like ATPase
VKLLQGQVIAGPAGLESAPFPTTLGRCAALIMQTTQESVPEIHDPTSRFIDVRYDHSFFTTKAQGTGMGLSISRRTIECHGGRLWACANAERGVTFQFTLPTAVAASSASAA